jgi:hypothetical protein
MLVHFVVDNRQASRAMASKTIICSSVRLLVLIQPGIKKWQRGKIHNCVPYPLKRGVHHNYSAMSQQLLMLGHTGSISSHWHLLRGTSSTPGGGGPTRSSAAGR